MIYPETRRTDAMEEHFGTMIADPYRWLEGDARSHPEVAEWVQAQDELARTHLAGLPGREAFRQRLAALFDHARLTAPIKRGDRYFFTRNPGLDDQAVLVMREGAYGPEHILIDPNTWAEDGAAALAEWAASEDGRHVAFARQEGGTDWRTIRVLDVESGNTLADEIAWARFTAIAWAHDGSGFFYSRFPEPPAANGFEAPVTGHAIYFHVLGTAQADDRLVHATAEGQLLIQTVGVTADGRYGVIYSTPGAGSNTLSIIDLRDPTWTPRPVIETQGHNWFVAGNQETRFFLMTDHGAERGKIVTFDLAATELRIVDLVEERDDATLNDAALLGGRLVITYLVHAKTEIHQYMPDGKPDGTVELPGIGSAGGFHGRPDDDEAFFVFTGYDAPMTIYRYDVASRQLEVWAQPEVAIDLGRIAVEQHFYQSKDGTRIPMFVVRLADVQASVPTILYGYGGYGISMVPYYSPPVLAWVEAGGAYAVANLRGGGEYGKAWHDAGRLANKQNVRRLRRRRRISEARRHRRCPRHRNPGGIQWRAIGRGRDQPAPRPFRRGPSRRRRDGHAALRPFHGRTVLDRGLRRSREGSRLSQPPVLFALSHDPLGDALSGDPGHDGGYRRPRRAGPQLQICRGASGSEPRRQTADPAGRQAGRPRCRETHR